MAKSYVPNDLLRGLRERLFGTQQAMADAANEHLAPAYWMNGNDIGKLERGVVERPSPPRCKALRTICCVAANAEIGLVRRSTASTGYGGIAARIEPAGEPGFSREMAVQPHSGPIEQLKPAWTVSLSPAPNPREPATDPGYQLRTPAGRALPGLTIPAQVHPAVLTDQVVAQTPPGYGNDPFVHQPGRALVVGQVDVDAPAAFLLDARRARKRLSGAPAETRLIIPRAYLLDHLTFSLLWAVANFDAALLDDDAALAETMREAAGYTLMSRSAASYDIAAELSPASRMWLGSQFCAGHILRHAPELAGPPLFWTREQRGEEAAAWLLFAHKQDYLRRTSTLGTSASPVTRIFCIPTAAVAASPAGERALLLLAAALIESYGIGTAVTDLPELANTPGFALDTTRRAITATWVGAAGIWYVDVTDNRGTVRDYGEAAGHAVHRSLIAAADPAQRLRRLADYLDLDWHWLTGRCRELGECGTSGLAQPRSRLLSLDGVDRACQYLAAAARPAR
jgi:hypothetical protein